MKTHILKKSLTVLWLVAFAVPAFAKADMSKFEKKAASFLLLKLDVLSKPTMKSMTKSSGASTGTTNTCVIGTSVECSEFVAGSYPNSDERLRAARACKANQDAECAKFVAGSYPNFDEREKAAKACKNNYGKDCAVFVAGSYPNSSERLAAAESCENAELDCVTFVAGSSPSLTERLEAAKACGGN